MLLLAFSNRIATAMNIEANDEYRFLMSAFGKEEYACLHSFGATSPRPVVSL
jgi:hypothetical protein